MLKKIIKSKKMVLAAMMAGVMSFGLMGNGVQAADKGAAGMKSAEVKSDRMIKAEKLQLTQAWDKVFPKSDKVDHRKVTFVNRYGITLAADMYVPRNAKGKLPALAVSGPFGAVKEQSSGLYAQEMAERGFLTIAFDPSFTGESGGQPRYVASPDINTEDFPQQWISCPPRKMWIKSVSALSASAAGVAWPSMQRPAIPASRLPWLPPCTI